MHYYFIDGLEKIDISVYIHNDATDDGAKVAGKVLVDAQVITCSCTCGNGNLQWYCAGHQHFGFNSPLLYSALCMLQAKMPP